MRRIALVGTLGLVMLAGCPSDNNTPDAGACSCSPPTALQVTYDKTSSQLGANNVQDAVDELAARPLPEPAVAGRIELVFSDVDSNPLAPLSDLTLECPQPTDKALSGSCGILQSGATFATFLGWELGTNGVACHYQHPVGFTAHATVTVTCLHKAQ